MALTSTTLVGAITADATTVQLTSATGVTAGYIGKMGSEYVKIQGITGTMATISRGYHGTKALAHAALSGFTHGPASDFPAERMPAPESYSYSVDGAVTIAPGLHKIYKAGVCALTLAAPSAAYDDLELTFVSRYAAAHTITYTAGFAGNTTSSDVLTFGGAVGDSVTLVAVDGVWAIKAAYNVTAG